MRWNGMYSVSGPGYGPDMRAAERFASTYNHSVRVQNCAQMEYAEGTRALDEGINDAYVSDATRTAERCDGFRPVRGWTIAQSVAARIDGVMHPANARTRQSHKSIYAIY